MMNRGSRTVHWIAVALALVPVPFAVKDAVKLQLWNAEWWFTALAVAYTLIVCLVVYGIVRGVAWLISRVRA